METSFGNWVRRRRKALDITQRELAERIGCSSSLIFKIESDERRPSRQVAELLALQLQIPADQHAVFLKAARQELAAFRLAEQVKPVVFQAQFAGDIHPEPLSASRETAISQAEQSQRSALPVFPTPFIGREHEIDIVVQQILDPACRLLTLTGPGGVGKTRLAIEVARRLETAFPGGVYFFAMAGVEQPESIVPVAADTLGLVFSGPADPKLQLIQALRQKKVLLVFDNMEHLISGSTVLSEILQQAPGVRMLLTSREPVRLQWEWIFEVQGLPVPESARPEALESNSAAALFMQRTQQAARQISSGNPYAADNGEPADPSIAMAARDAEAVVQICRLVDGLPLAIELAASWARVMSPGEIAEELARGLDLLQTTLQDVPARHRSIRLVFDHSWKLLTGEEQAAVKKLAVFPGGFTRDAALNVAGISVVLLSALVSKSLLRFRKTAGRYDFHELVRQYALTRLSESPEEEQTANALHAGYYAGWLANLEGTIKSARQIEASSQIRAEKANWSAAWYWAARQQRLDLLRRMEPCMYWFNEIHGDNAEAVTSIAFAVNELRSAGAPAALTGDAEIGAYALLVDQLGWFEFRLGNIERAAALFTESQVVAERMTHPDYEVLYYIHINWGYMSLVTGDLETARRLTQESLEDARALGGQWHAAIAINILGIVEYQRGNLQEAYRQLKDSLKIWREVGDLRGLVFCMLYLSAAALALKDYAAAETHLLESNAIAQQKHDRWAHAFGLDLLGQAAAARGDMAAAVEYFQHSQVLSREIGDQLALTQTLIHLGEAHAALGEYAFAQSLFCKAYENARDGHWQTTILDALVAALTADAEIPARDALVVILAVLENPVLSLVSRGRAEALRSRLAAELLPPLLREAQTTARQKSAEEWAGAYFSDRGSSPVWLKNERPPAH